ncbi:hypothetical protein [Vibrio intestinalis]|nr:hypothetical protein [Vibrio intestinalis]
MTSKIDVIDGDLYPPIFVDIFTSLFEEELLIFQATTIIGSAEA